MNQADNAVIANMALPLIQINGDTQARMQLDWIALEEYTVAMAAGAQFPPVIVYQDAGGYWLADGFHRLEAAKRAGLSALAVEIRQGSRRDALLFACSANAAHGVRRTNADKRKAVTILLQDDEWSHWSDREIARRCNVTNHLVAELRQKLTGNSPSDATARTYITKHGTPAVMQTANIGGNGKAKTLPVGLAEPEDDGEDDSRLCPSCGEYAYLVHGGAGRYWWRCENCKCETGATYYENVAKIWSDTVAGKLPMHFYADESPEDDERLTVIDEWGSGETVTASYGSEITIAPLPTQTPIAVLPEMLMQVTVINADSSRYLADYVHGPVHLVVTSPPYNVGIEYDTYHDGSEVHAEMLAEVWRQCYDLLVEGGRIAVVVPFGVGRNPWTPVASEVMQQLIAAGFTLRGQIIWDKGTSGNRTTWGSFRLPSDPSLRDTTECIVVAHKGTSRLDLPEAAKGQDAKGSFSPWMQNSDYFMELAQDHWTVAPESSQSVGHPAPFPVELVRRLIHFYGYRGCHVVDPFAGSGTVGVVAKELGCQATLMEISADYCALSERRIANAVPA